MTWAVVGRGAVRNSSRAKMHTGNETNGIRIFDVLIDYQ
jgi:hypothetical protein